MLRVGEVGGDVVLPQGPVPGAQYPGVVDAGGGAALLVGGPPGVPVVQERHVGGDAGAGDVRAERGEVGAEPFDLLEAAALGTGVADHPGVELLGALPGLAPLEVADGVGAPGDRLEGPQPVHAARLGMVHAPPADRPGRLFHQHPGGAARLGAGEVLDEGALLRAERVARVRVEVDRDDVLLGRPPPAVLPGEQGHEVGGDREVRGVAGGRCRVRRGSTSGARRR